MHFNHNGSKHYFIIPMIFGGIILAFLMAFLLGYFVMILWNWLMPVLFGFVKITYWQAWGLVLLSHILFKFNPFHRVYSHHKGRRFDKECFKERVREKFNKEKEDTEE